MVSSSQISSRERSRTPGVSRPRRFSASRRSTCTRRRFRPTRSTSGSRSSFPAEAGLRGHLHGADGVGRRAVQAAGDDGDALPRPPLLRPSGELGSHVGSRLRRCAASRTRPASAPLLDPQPTDAELDASRKEFLSRSEPAHQRDPPGRRCVRALRVAQGARALSRGDARRACVADLARGLRRGACDREGGRRSCCRFPFSTTGRSSERPVHG